MVITTSPGAAADRAACERLAGEVNKLHIDTVVARGGHGQDYGRMSNRFKAENFEVGEQDPQPAWVALAFDDSQTAVLEAERILDAIDLSETAPLSEPAGPDFDLHWTGSNEPAAQRIWPLPWPGRSDRAGWVTMLTSWLLMLLLTALAILIAIILFQNFPPQAPPPPIPTKATGSGGGGSGSPQSASASAQSSSASPQTGSGQPTPPKKSRTPNMESANPTGTASIEGSPSPNKKL
ncbi:MAG: hypothetical protein CR979_03855 [Propionibacterium sp.]|nr:MAG: hypothetical protein CR979_03855 [Propionibacterium sp.]